MTLAEQIRQDMAREQLEIENAKRYRDSQIGRVYKYCEVCGTQVSRSQYGRDDECPKCGKWVNW